MIINSQETPKPDEGILNSRMGSVTNEIYRCYDSF